MRVFGRTAKLTISLLDISTKAMARVREPRVSRSFVLRLDPLCTLPLLSFFFIAVRT